jgi:2-oxo-3-hexenedioate decarboxylase
LPIADIDALAARILAASGNVSSIAPISDALPGFDLADAYRISAAVTQRRIARGERPLGWKIGFTNETIWDEYGVHAPIWGPMYETTVAEVDCAAGPVTVPIHNLVEPRIEPEIAFRLGAIPDAAMDERALLTCIDAAAHGFEIVQSLYPDWRFKAADTVAAFALHGCYRCGRFVRIAPTQRDRWFEQLAGFGIALYRDGVEIDHGISANVLGGGPLTALRYLVRGFADYPAGYAFRVGDIVTTGTVTRAFPVAPGERWSTKLEGIPLPSMDVVLA